MWRQWVVHRVRRRNRPHGHIRSRSTAITTVRTKVLATHATAARIAFNVSSIALAVLEIEHRAKGDSVCEYNYTTEDKQSSTHNNRIESIADDVVSTYLFHTRRLSTLAPQLVRNRSSNSSVLITSMARRRSAHDTTRHASFARPSRRRGRCGTRNF